MTAAASLALLALLGADDALVLGPKPAAHVERVVTLAPSLTETVLKLGAGAALVGVSRFDEAGEVAKLPRVGGFTDPSVEAIVALKPQLLVAQRSPGNRQAVEKVAELGVPVLALPLTSIADVVDGIRRIALALGRQTEGAALIARIDEARSRAHAKKRGEPKHVMLIYGFKPLVVAGPGSFADELLTDIGAVNVAQKAPSAYPVFSVERALALRPDVVVDCSDVADGRAELKALMKASRWVESPSRALLQPGPSLADGLGELERLVYSD